MSISLRTKIYLSMLAMILVSFLVTFAVTIYDQYEQNESYNDQRFFQKEESIRASMDYFLNQYSGSLRTDSITILFSDKICELSDVHDVFIALFDLRGRYLISSNFVEMDSLAIPSSVNYTILKQLSTGNQRAVIDKNFSNGQYSMAYWYFNDDKGKPIAVTNVVYEKSFDRLSEIKSFLREILQSYILLFLFAALVAFLLSRYITKSLQTIGKRFKEVQIGHHNEPLHWPEKDEIGALVQEYNRMLAELESNIRKLAQSERESAWREMAQQVAHEIKNPLTPMKLRMQQLVRSWEDGNQDFDRKLHAFSQSMIEQIDALSRIASSFSQYAKMPKPELAPTDIAKLITSVCELYREKENIELSLRTSGEFDPVLLLDKDQMIRVMNNLITNAIQAVPTDKKGLIDVLIRGGRGGILVRVNDNGCGIGTDQRKNIFVPNFTTKSTGTGLGLAMVKSIIEQSGGQVWFWSKENRGASFYIYFPRVKEKSA